MAELQRDGQEPPVGQRYQTLLAVSAAIVSHRDKDALFRDLSDRLHQVVDFDVLDCILHDTASNTLHRHVSEGTEPSADDPSGLVWETQHPLIISNVAEETRWPQFQERTKQFNSNSVCFVPLTSAHRRLGVLGFGSNDTGAYDAADLGFLQHVANQVAVALENALAFEEIRGLKDKLHREKEQLRRNEQELRTITDAIRQFVVVLTPDGDTLYANKVALECTGYTLADLTDHDLLTRAGVAKPAYVPGQPSWNQVWRVVAHPDDLDRIQAERRRGLSLGVPFDMEARLRFKSGEYRWQLFQYNALKDESGQIIRWYVTATDIDDRKRKEDQLRNENVLLREEIDRSSMYEEIVGCSTPLRKVLSDLARVAPTDTTVLIQGETGTGKELIARAIHKQSNRSAQPFICVNCAAIPQSLIGSELFGHEKGAFTGATQRRLGRFESANRGTIFLDEVGELSAEIQASLLRVLQEREFERVGSSQSISVDVRVIAATNRDLKEAANSGSFREDLFYRLNVFPIRVPPLRERRDDIPLLVRHAVLAHARKLRKRLDAVAKEAMDALVAYDWPGNVRELQNVVERGVILASDSAPYTLDLGDWLPTTPPSSARPLQVQSETRELSAPVKPAPSTPTLEDVERRHIIEVLELTDWRVSGPRGAAHILGLKPTTLEARMKRLGIARPSH